MRQVVQNLLAEKSYKLEVCLYFLRKFLRRANDAIYPVELIIPLWLAVVFEKPDTDGLFFSNPIFPENFQKFPSVYVLNFVFNKFKLLIKTDLDTCPS